MIYEVCVNLLRKAHLDEERIQNLIASFYSAYRVIEPGREILEKGSELRKRYHHSYWDSLIVAAALFGSATVLYSEDMHAGLEVDGQLKIVNPFV